MDDRDVALACAGLAVAALLIGALAYPAAMIDPIDRSAPYQYHSVHESAPGYEDAMDAIEDRDASAADLREVRYEDLSPEARRAFDRTRSDADGRGEGVWDPTVCQPHFVGCPYVAASDLPPELANGYLDDPVESAVFVDTGDGRYLFHTPAATPGHVDGVGLGVALLYLWKLVVFLPFAVFLAAFGLSPALSWRRRPAVGLGVAVVLTVLGYWAFGDLDPFWLWVPPLLGAFAAVVPRAEPRWLRAAATGAGLTIAVVAIATPYVVLFADQPRAIDVAGLIVTVLSVGGIPVLSLLALVCRDEGPFRDLDMP